MPSAQLQAHVTGDAEAPPVTTCMKPANYCSFMQITWIVPMLIAVGTPYGLT